MDHDRSAAVRVKALAAVLAVFLCLGLASAGFAQEGTQPDAPAASAEERVPGSAWLLPIIDLTKFEPVTWTLAICSVVAVTLIIQGFMRVRRAIILPPESTERIQELIAQKQYRELMDFTAADDSFVSRALSPALKRAPNLAEMKEALEAGVAEETSEQFRKLDYINLLANIGPLLGLLGTVIGIMDAFLAMRRAGGQAEVSQLAAGISTALGTTLVGLCLAVPCLIAYSILRNRADRLTQEGAELSEELLLSMRGDGRPPATPAAVPAAPAARPVAARPAGGSPSPVAGAGQTMPVQ
jgi:biopolymer transport protein ExbB